MKRKNGENGSTTEANANSSFKASNAAMVVMAVVLFLTIDMFVNFSPAKLLQLTNSPADSVVVMESVVSLDRREAPNPSGETTVSTPTNTPTTATATTTANTTTTTETTTNNNNNNNKPPIREWGCHRTETPFIFVHIGKAGGGEIRARLAGGAEDYNRTRWHLPDQDNHFYPIGNGIDTTTEGRKAKFCNSIYANSRLIPENNHTTPLRNPEDTFEGEQFCNATTPFGMAIACPIGYRNSRNNRYESKRCLGCDDEHYLEEQYYQNDANSKSDLNAAANKAIDPPPSRHTCDTVYVSHNYLGGELNWLPPRYLKEHWWDNSSWKRTTNQNQNSNHKVDDELEKYWASLLYDRKHRRKNILKQLNNNTLLLLEKIDLQNSDADESDEIDNSQRWCPAGYVGYHSSGIQYDRPTMSNANWEQNKDRYLNCAKPIAERTDRLFREFWNEQQTQEQEDSGHSSSSSDSSSSIDENDYSPVYASLPLHRVTMLREPFSWLVSKFFWGSLKSKCDNIHFRIEGGPNMSWIEVMAFEYLFYLCGSECQTRYENNLISIERIEAQAKGNLRNSFSVVGLLHESQSFYEMIHKRIDYLDMNKTIIKGGRHSTKHKEDKARCIELYLKNETFQEHVRSSLPAFAALERVYSVGVEVNRFQKDELGRCD